jgi:flavin reductase (DIM6/NTAB) family NADH-FMN oxidoreductase RutF
MSAIDQATYRRVLGHFPTGVTVIAGMDGDEPVGLAVGSFFSLSLDPALVGFCVDRSSGSWARMSSSGTFSVNILGADQEEVSRVFATSGEDKFKTIGWKPAESGSPLIDGVLAWIDCAVEDVHDGGDHEIVVGRVLGLDVGNEGGPLIFYRGGYANLK